MARRDPPTAAGPARAAGGTARGRGGARPPGRRWIALACAAATGVLGGCDAPQAPASGPEAAAGSTRAAAPTEAEVQRLRTLGYLDTVEPGEPDDPSLRGVRVHDAKRSWRGYDLYPDRIPASAHLLDPRGRIVREWRDPQGRRWSRVRMLPDGDLVAVGVLETRRAGKALPEDRYVARLGWDGHVEWRKRIAAHHDIEPLPDGRLLTLTMHNRSLPGIDAELPVRDDAITLLSADGEVEQSVSIHDLLAALDPPFAFQPVAPTLDKGDAHVDLIHANSVQVFDQPVQAGAGPLHRPGHLLLTSRHQDVVAVVDWNARRVLWTWGPGEVSGPHDARWLANGHILVFDNGLGRNWSRVVEVDPASRAIVWEYRAPEPERFYTASRGSAQRLPNGNTLITNSGRGHAFEITPEGEVVWEFFNPDISIKGRRSVLPRLLRLSPTFVEALLRGERPSDPAEPPA